MTALTPDRDQVETFVNALFKHAGTEGFASCRSFPDGDSDKPFNIKSAFLAGGLKHVVDIAVHEAKNAANASLKVVFCPPVATFKGTRQKRSWQAREKDLLRGLALSVECDERAQAARARLEKLLGPATIVTLSGGQWTDHETGEVHPKLHLHWRLQTPAEGEASLAKLKRARDLATRLVGGDPTNKAICHPIRWPGSWHRKGEPVLCRVETANLDCEIDLDGALTVLTAASGNGHDKPQGRGTSSDPHDVPPVTDDELIADVHSGRAYHGPLVQLAARHIGRGSTAKEAITFLQGLMNESAGERDERWYARVASIPSIVASAEEKYGQRAKGEARNEASDEKAEAPKRPVLPLQWHGDAPWQSPKWMIRNRLPETGAGLLVGQWGMLKTFMALDLSAHVMRGWAWTGEPVYRQCGVLCLAQEGSGSIPMRLAALVEHKIKEPNRLPFTWASRCPMLLGTDKGNPLPLLVATAELAHERFMKEFGLPLGLIWIDTMSSAGGWSDENNNAEAAQLMNVLRTLSEMSGAVVVGVDHLGKNVDAGSRGASAKEANSDFVLALLGNKDLAGNITDMRLALRKVREGPSGMEFPVAPKVVDMGQDEKGWPLTSVVLDWNVKRISKEKKSNAHQVLDHALAVALKEHGQMVKTADGREVRAVKRMHVLVAYKAAYKPDKDVGDGAKRQAFRQALVQAAGRIASETISGVDCLWFNDAPF